MSNYSDIEFSNIEFKLTDMEKHVLLESLKSYRDLLRFDLVGALSYVRDEEFSKVISSEKENIVNLSQSIKHKDVSNSDNPIEIYKDEVLSMIDIIESHDTHFSIKGNLMRTLSYALDFYLRIQMGDLKSALEDIEDYSVLPLIHEYENEIFSLKEIIYSMKPNHSMGAFSDDLVFEGKVCYQLLQAVNTCGAFPGYEKPYLTVTGEPKPYIYDELFFK